MAEDLRAKHFECTTHRRKLKTKLGYNLEADRVRFVEPCSDCLKEAYRAGYQKACSDSLDNTFTKNGAKYLRRKKF